MDQFIELRIALEALCLTDNSNEKRYRLATYGAWHLGESFKERRLYFDKLYKMYNIASKAVHAGTLKEKQFDKDLLTSTQDICRQGILKRLEEVEEPNWDNLVLGSEIDLERNQATK